MSIPLSAILGSILFLANPLVAQEQISNPDTQTALQEWQDSHGETWILRTADSKGGFARTLFGGRNEPIFTPETDADWFELARIAFDESYSMFGVEDTSLIEDAVNLGFLESIGMENKIGVTFQQEVDGVPVKQSSVTAIFTPQGQLLALDSQGLPHLSQANTKPTRSRFSALSFAHQDYREQEGREATQFTSPKLMILGHRSEKTTTPRLVWAIELRTPDNESTPSGRRYFVSARNGLEILHTDELIHHQSLEGTVATYATPGTSPYNTATLHPVAHAYANSSAGWALTDKDGNFSIPYSGTTALDVEVFYIGTYCQVNHETGLDYTLTQSVSPGVHESFVMNPNPTETITAQANAFDSVNDFQAWIQATDPNDTHMNFQIEANTNLSQTCNAYYNGSSINFYKSGGGCPNTSYSSVVAHEEGHWANDLYNSGNGWDGFGEGQADAWANYIYDSPIVGEDFFSSGSDLRTGLNTRQFCGDGNGGCYNGVHADGEVLMGALWKVRRNLNIRHGNDAGDLIADTLMLAWMNLFDDSEITTAIEDHWLIIDDDDGNVGNGTPSYSDIDSGFREQGFPGVNLNLIQFDHTPLGTQNNENGPYIVEADIQSLIGSTIVSANVVYRVNDGSDITTAMTQTVGNTWVGGIPGQISPTVVSYSLEANDALGNLAVFPADGPFEFVIGVLKVLYFNDFEGATDEGWTHSGVNDDWQRGAPQGKDNDPGQAYSGSQCWGTALGQGNSTGLYATDSRSLLSSPSIDCSNASNIRMSFQRVLHSEKGTYDQAQVYGDSQLLWENDLGADHHDTGWQSIDMDISAVADNNPSLNISFLLESDWSIEYAGWNIDDLLVYCLAPLPGNADQIQLTGTTQGTAGQSASWSLSLAPANAPYWLLYSMSNTGTSISGHAFDIGSPWFIADNGTTNTLGEATVNATLPPNSVGLTVYLEAAANLGGISDSNILTLQIQ